MCVTVAQCLLRARPYSKPFARAHSVRRKLWVSLRMRPARPCWPAELSQGHRHRELGELDSPPEGRLQSSFRTVTFTCLSKTLLSAPRRVNKRACQGPLQQLLVPFLNSRRLCLRGTLQFGGRLTAEAPSGIPRVSKTRC